MAIRFVRFEDMKIWKEASQLTLDIYKIFKENRDYGFKDQIQRAAVSVMNNIAEGYERGTVKLFISYLLIAKGSCGEVRSMLYLGFRLSYLNQDEYQRLTNQAVAISRMIHGFIRSLKDQDNS